MIPTTAEALSEIERDQRGEQPLDLDRARVLLAVLAMVVAGQGLRVASLGHDLGKLAGTVAACEAFFLALMLGGVPSCYAPKDEATALFVNCALSIIGRNRFGKPSKIGEVHELVRRANITVAEARAEHEVDVEMIATIAQEVVRRAREEGARQERERLAAEGKAT